jgi:hypothetical protein
MPSGKNWLNFIYINLAFGIYVAGIFYFNKINEVKNNWPAYRCNPMYMPLADDIDSNFTYCIQNSMSSFMGFIMEPITFATSSLSDMGGGFVSEINMVRGMFDKVRTFLSSIIQSVFGIFLNLIIEFQKIIIGVKDLMAKTIGIMVTLLYTIDGSIKTMKSAWNGPAGQLLKALGACFHPNTKVKLKNQTVVFMKDLNLGDVLESGSIVRTILKIDNYKKEPLYKIPNQGIDDEDIYVTGSHYVLDKQINKYICVCDYNKAILSDRQTDWFTCLVTSDNKIVLNNEHFWDWEDDNFTINYFNKYLSNMKI